MSSGKTITKGKSAVAIFSAYYIFVSVVYILGFLIGPTSKNGLGFLALAFAWPFVATFGLIFMHLYLLVPVVLTVIVISLYLQARYWSYVLQNSISKAEVDGGIPQRRRLIIIISLETVLFALIVIVPSGSSYIPLSIGMWLLTLFPVAIAGVIARKRKNL